MKKNFLPILLFALTIIVALSPFIPSIKGIWHVEGSSQAIIDKIITCLGVLFALLGAFISLQLVLAKNEIREMGIDIKKQFLNNFRVEKVSSEDFYWSFLAQAKMAKKYVCISYFAPFPPTAAMRKERDSYYKEMDKLIQKVDGKIIIRRLVRWSEENRSWIQEMLKKFETCPGFELAVLEDIDSSEPMPLALSVQIIDGRHVWIVAAGGHEQRGSDRDLYVDSDVVASYLQNYFERLWHHATPLKDASQGLTKNGLDLLTGVFKGGAQS